MTIIANNIAGRNLPQIFGDVDANFNWQHGNLFLSGYYVKSDGTLVSSGTRKYTDYIDVNDLEEIRLRGFTNGSSVALIAYYDKFKVFISAVTDIELHAVETTIQKTAFPENTRYIRCSGIGDGGDYLYAYNSINLHNRLKQLPTGIAQAESGILSNASSKNITYSHPRGASEMVTSYLTDGTYMRTSRLLGFSMYAENAIAFNALQSYIYQHSGTYSEITCRVYVSDTNAITSQTLAAQAELLAEKKFTSNQLNQNTLKNMFVRFDETYIIPTKKYVFVVFSSIGDVELGSYFFQTQAEDEPLRLNPFRQGGTAADPLDDVISVISNNYSSATRFFNVKENVDIVLPEIIYVTEGRELNIWYNHLIPFKPERFYIEPYCSVGKIYENCFRFTPVVANVGNSYKIKIAVKNSDGDLVDELISTIKVVSKTAGTGSKIVLPIGASLIHHNFIADEVVNLFTTDGGLQVSTIGTQKQKNYPGEIDGTNFTEGNPGWVIGDYVDVKSGYKFNVTGAIGLEILEMPSYSNNGSSFRFREAELDENGDGYLVGGKISGTNEPSASGTLTSIVVTDSPTSVIFTSVESISENPFHNHTDGSGGIDIAGYITRIGASGLDCAVILIGNNGSLGSLRDISEIEGRIADFKELIDAILVYNANAKIVIVPPPTSGLQDAHSENPATYSYESYIQNIVNTWKLQVDEFDSAKYGANISVCHAPLWLNREYGYEQTTEALSARQSTVNITRNTNVLHPNPSGYYQLADAIYSHLRGILTE